MRKFKLNLIGFIGVILWILAPVGIVWAQSEEIPESAASGSNWGYIGIGALIVLAIIYILLKKQYRRFNE